MTSVAQIKSNEEPPSGIQGKGTIDEPYDQGNAPGEFSAASSVATEPPTNGFSSSRQKIQLPQMRLPQALLHSQ